MGGILSTIFGLKSGDAKGTNVDQPQTNHGNRGPAVTHGDQSGSSSGHYAAPGVPVYAVQTRSVPVNNQGGHGGHYIGTGTGYAGTGGPGEGNVTINHYLAEGRDAS